MPFLQKPQRHSQRAACLLALVAGVLFTSCAGVSHRMVKDNKRETGLRYYNSSPYILVYTNSQGGLTTDFVYLQDQEQLWRAKRFAFLSSNKMEMTLVNGILTDSTADSDASEVPKAIIGALEKVATTAAAGMKFLAPGGPEVPATVVRAPYAPPVALFKVVKNPDGEWGLVGATAPESVKYQKEP